VVGRHTAANYTASTDNLSDHLSGIDSALGAAVTQGAVVGLQLAWATVDTVTIGAGFCADSTGAEVITVSSTLTGDLSTTGANGLDTGARAVDTWYHLHVIKGSSGVASLWSLSRTAPTLPSGYTDAFRWVGTFYNVDDTFSGELRNLVHIEGLGISRLFFLHEPAVDAKVLTDGAATTWTDLDFSAYCPPTSRVVRIIPHLKSQSFGPVCYWRMDGSTPTLGQTALGIDGRQMGSPIDVLMSTAQVSEYFLDDPWVRLDVYVLAYYLELGLT
jgi:hypothetical protein